MAEFTVLSQTHWDIVAPLLRAGDVVYLGRAAFQRLGLDAAHILLQPIRCRFPGRDPGVVIQTAGANEGA